MVCEENEAYCIVGVVAVIGAVLAAGREDIVVLIVCDCRDDGESCDGIVASYDDEKNLIFLHLPRKWCVCEYILCLPNIVNMPGPIFMLQ